MYDDDADQGVDQTRRFLDPVHDYIEFEPLVSSFVDTPEFQRLRHLKQLGSAYAVFPGGSHNRFEHSLGVAHLARKMVDGLRERQPNLMIDDRDVICVQIAGLCHDLGHGPFSHVFDNQFIPRARPGIKWSHEQGSEMMLDSLIKNNSEIDIDPDWVDFIKDLIRGRPLLTLSRIPPEKSFLFEIVANNINGVDVDKFDYIARDTVNCGDKCNLVTSRLVNSCRVVDGHICYQYKDFFTVHELFHARYSLHKRIYNHKTAKAIEYMLVDALVAADPILKLSDTIYDAEKYLFVTDSVVEEIERSTNPLLAESRALLRRIRKRDLYRQTDLKVLPSKYKALWGDKLTSESIAETAKTIEDSLMLPISSKDIIVDFTFLHMGMKEQDPMKLVRFFQKQNPNESFVARTEEGSQLLATCWQELMVRIFTRDPKKLYSVQQAFRALVKTLPDSETEPVSPVDTVIAHAEDPHTPLLTSSFALQRSAPGSPSPQGLMRRSGAKDDNQFMTVPPNYQASPPSSSRWKRSRSSLGEVNIQEEPAQKKR